MKSVLQLLAFPVLHGWRLLVAARSSAELLLSSAVRTLLGLGRSARESSDDRWPRATNVVLRTAPLPLALVLLGASALPLLVGAAALSAPERYYAVSARSVEAEVLAGGSTVRNYSDASADNISSVAVVELDGAALAVPELEADPGDVVTVWITESSADVMAAQSSTTTTLDGRQVAITAERPVGGHKVDASDVTWSLLSGLAYALLAAAALASFGLGVKLLAASRHHPHQGSLHFWIGPGVWERAKKRVEVLDSWRPASLLALVGVPLVLVPPVLVLAPPFLVRGASYDDYSSFNAYAGLSVMSLFFLGPVALVVLRRLRALAELAFERLVWPTDAELSYPQAQATPWAQRWLERRGLDDEVLVAFAPGHTGTCGDLVDVVKEFDHS